MALLLERVRRLGPFPLKFVTVFAGETMTSIHTGFAFVIFPDLIEARLGRDGSQWLLFQNVAFVIALQFKNLWLLAPVEPVGEHDQNCPSPFHSAHDADFREKVTIPG